MKELGITTETQSEWKDTAAPVIRKARTPRPIFVEIHVETIGEQGKWKQAKSCDTVTEAEKWLKKEGEAGATYRIITVEREVKLVVESKRVASFA